MPGPLKTGQQIYVKSQGHVEHRETDYPQSVHTFELEG